MTDTDILSLPCRIDSRTEHKIAGAVVDAILNAQPFHHIAVHGSEEFAMAPATRDRAAIMAALASTNHGGTRVDQTWRHSRRPNMAALASTNHDRLYVYDRADMVDGQLLGYVLLVYGNGRDLIADGYLGSDHSWLSKLMEPLLNVD